MQKTAWSISMKNYPLIKFTFLLILAGVHLLTGTIQKAEAAGTLSVAERCIENDKFYTVQPGDHLHRIGNHFGNHRFWEAIYIANADQMDNPHRIFPGQEIRIPGRVYNYRETDSDVQQVLMEPFCSVSSLPIDEIRESFLSQYELGFLKILAEEEQRETEIASAESDTSEMSEEELLEAFREAFEAVASSDQDQAATQEQGNQQQQSEQQQQQAEQQMFIEVDGMIHDETHSKVGRDFYDMFYSNWQAPEEATNFSIRISEQPTPNMGTMVTVKVNDTEVFQNRLQPRYDYIEEAGRFAVRMAYSHLQENQNQFLIY